MTKELLAELICRPEDAAFFFDRSLVRSTLKVACYFLALLGLVCAINLVEGVFLKSLCILALGIVFAHGLELQHEALHNNLFRSRSANELFGVLFGIPMLVSFSHYRFQHLHHHKYLGTDQDRELFDYRPESLLSPIGFIVRAWNLLRIPTLFVTLLGLLQGEEHPGWAAAVHTRIVREYLLLVILFIAGVVVTVHVNSDAVLLSWFVPWLLVGEFVHFLIELPEHMFCDKSTPNPLKNSRSYMTNGIWQYITNGNNFHVEHHAFARVAVHRLAAAHQRLRPFEKHAHRSYWELIGRMFGEISSRRATRSAEQVPFAKVVDDEDFN